MQFNSLPQASALPASEAKPAPEIPLPETLLPESPAMQQHVVQDDADEHLLPVFLEEADDIFPHVGSNMRAWRERPEDKALGRSLHRRLHTLKGSARMAGAMHVGDLTHRMEECAVQAMAQTRPDMAAHDELEDYFGRIGNALEQLRNENILADQTAVEVAAQQEQTRFMNESAHDVVTVQQAPPKNLDEASAALSTQTCLKHESQQNLMAIRRVPFASIGERLHRIVRQTSRELNKKAMLELRGDEVELDRSMLDRMTAPLEHMLRNAIAHGLESPAQRERMGKPPIGVISLSLRQEGNEVIFELSDDGAGINLARLRQKAVELGMLQPGENAGDERVMQLIFAPGVTTATEVTEVSGRGIGMDVVRSEITALGGRIEVSSKRGKGTRFISHLPLTLMSTQALPVRAGQAAHSVEHGRTSDAPHLMSPQIPSIS